ncbi:hypothetical protein ASE37_23535 [Rhizobium sp. Root268]|nr:hypothetical protein ASC86_22490 [Rhizobium sp. Root1212]KRD31717.1 hypothetical protein ASE37_23535 [Rhizobium sp. Root268]
MDGAHGIDLEDGFGSLGKDARFIHPVGDDVARGDQNAMVESQVIDHAMAIGHLQRGPMATSQFWFDCSTNRVEV